MKKMSQSARPGSISNERKRASGAPHQVRIIGGRWKRTPLDVLDAQGLRPTPDRVRETAFNWLETRLGLSWLGVYCLDLFAGTGALGFEAASRGAAGVIMVENQTSVAQQLKHIKEKLHAMQIQIVCGDAEHLAQRGLVYLLGKDELERQRRFRIIFLDPPYQKEWLPKILEMCRDALTKDGMIYVEAEYSLIHQPVPVWLEGWDVIRHDRAGQVFYHLLVPIAKNNT